MISLQINPTTTNDNTDPNIALKRGEITIWRGRFTQLTIAHTTQTQEHRSIYTNNNICTLSKRHTGGIYTASYIAGYAINTLALQYNKIATWDCRTLSCRRKKLKQHETCKCKHLCTFLTVSEVFFLSFKSIHSFSNHIIHTEGKHVQSVFDLIQGTTFF